MKIIYQLYFYAFLQVHIKWKQRDVCTVSLQIVVVIDDSPASTGHHLPHLWPAGPSSGHNNTIIVPPCNILLIIIDTQLRAAQGTYLPVQSLEFNLCKSTNESML